MAEDRMELMVWLNENYMVVPTKLYVTVNSVKERLEKEKPELECGVIILVKCLRTAFPSVTIKRKDVGKKKMQVAVGLRQRFEDLTPLSFKEQFKSMGYCVMEYEGITDGMLHYRMDDMRTVIKHVIIDAAGKITIKVEDVDVPEDVVSRKESVLAAILKLVKESLVCERFNGDDEGCTVLLPKFGVKEHVKVCTLHHRTQAKGSHRKKAKVKKKEVDGRALDSVVDKTKPKPGDKCYRWEKSMIQHCLSIFTASPDVYKKMRMGHDGKGVGYPSVRLLQYYRSVLQKNPDATWDSCTPLKAAASAVTASTPDTSPSSSSTPEASDTEISGNAYGDAEATDSATTPPSSTLEASAIAFEASAKELKASTIALEASAMEFEATVKELQASTMELEASVKEFEATAMELEASSSKTLAASTSTLGASSSEVKIPSSTLGISASTPATSASILGTSTPVTLEGSPLTLIASASNVEVSTVGCSTSKPEASQSETEASPSECEALLSERRASPSSSISEHSSRGASASKRRASLSQPGASPSKRIALASKPGSSSQQLSASPGIPGTSATTPDASVGLTPTPDASMGETSIPDAHANVSSSPGGATVGKTSKKEKVKKPRSENTKGPKCWAYNCQNYKNKKTRNISFHKFPNKKTHKKLYYEWYKRCKKIQEPDKYARLCSAHFLPADINSTLNVAQLREGVVPCIFDFPDHLKPKPAKKRHTKTSANAAAPLEPSEIPCMSSAHDLYPSTSSALHPSTSSDLHPGKSSATNAAKKEPTVDTFMEHAYHVTDAGALKKKIAELEKENDRLRQSVKNITAREKRAKKALAELQEEKAAKNWDDIQLRDKLRAYNGIPCDLFAKPVNGYSAAQKKFALRLHSLSKAAYNYLRGTVGLSLPGPKVLRRWMREQESADANGTATDPGDTTTDGHGTVMNLNGTLFVVNGTIGVTNDSHSVDSEDTITDEEDASTDLNEHTFQELSARFTEDQIDDQIDDIPDFEDSDEECC